MSDLVAVTAPTREDTEMTAKPYTDTDVEAVAAAIAATRVGCDPADPCRGCLVSSFAVLDALAAAGRLTPLGSTDD